MHASGCACHKPCMQLHQFCKLPTHRVLLGRVWGGGLGAGGVLLVGVRVVACVALRRRAVCLFPAALPLPVLQLLLLLLLLCLGLAGWDSHLWPAALLQIMMHSTWTRLP